MLLTTLFFGGALVLVLIYGIQAILKQLNIALAIFKLPGPPLELMGNIGFLRQTSDKIFQGFRENANNYYPIYKSYFLLFSAASIVNPYDFEIVMSNMKHNTKGRFYDLLHFWLRSGLLTSKGKKWQTRRKILTPAFHFNILQDFIKIFHFETERLVEVLKTKSQDPFVRVTDVISDFTLNSIGATAMGTNFDTKTADGRKYKKAVYDIGQFYVSLISKPWFYEKIILRLHPLYYKQKKIVDVLHKFTKTVIKQREQNFQPVKVEDLDNLNYSKRKRLAMLDLLLSTKIEDGSIDHDGICEEVDTFMFEGHDTTSVAIGFALMLIACHPQIQDQIVQEVKEVLGNNKTPDYKALNELSYLERVIKEVLRLYPSVPLISRHLGEDITTHSGHKLKDGSHVVLHIYDVHHNAKFFPNPEKFDPDRFLPENSRSRHNFAFIPFSAGPRNCIGQKFAVLEIKAVLSRLLSEFILEPVDTPESIVLISDMVVRTKDPIKVKFVPRKTK